MKIFGNPTELAVLRGALEMHNEVLRDCLCYDEQERDSKKPEGWDELLRRIEVGKRELEVCDRLMAEIDKLADHKAESLPDLTQKTPPEPPEQAPNPAPTPCPVTKEPVADAPRTPRFRPKPEALEQRKAELEAASDPRAADIAVPPKSKPVESDNKNLYPTSDGAIAIGRTLPTPFTNTDLRARLDGDGDSRSYAWVASWKGRGWIETVGFGSYKVTERFGK